jgi:adenosine 3'-phospho 5'-phosphosulfate transporter B3
MHSNVLNPKERIDFLCFDLSVFSRSGLFIVLTTITFAFFLIYGYLQELLFQLPGFDQFSWFLTLVQFFFYALFAFGESVMRNERQRKIPIKSYLLIAFLTVATMGLSNGSLPYLNYPTQVMFKCCKVNDPYFIIEIIFFSLTCMTTICFVSQLIPVLIGGILIQGKKFNIYDIMASVMMSFGLIFFTLADVQVQPSFQLIGVVLISGALVADAAIGNVQEKQMKLYKASNVEVVSSKHTNLVFIF